MEAEEEGYVRARIQQGQQGAFDAGAYSFFGDMAPLDEGLGGALEDGLEAPPEEWPAQGALEDDDDLPIEALMDDDEDEDLSLAALLRRQMRAQQEEDHGASASSNSKAGHHAAVAAPVANAVNGLSSSKAAAAHSQHQQPLLPPMPPQPQMLGHLGQQGAAPAAGPSLADAVVPAAAPVAATTLQRPPAAATPSGMLSAAELEARMLSSANQQAAQQQQQPQAQGGQLLSMLKAGAGAGAGAAAFGQQQQPPRQPSQLHGRALPPPGHPGMPLQGPPTPFGPGMLPPGPPGGLDPSLQQQQQPLPPPLLADGVQSGPYPGMPPPQMAGPYSGLPPHMLPPLPHPLQGGPGPLPPPSMHGGPHPSVPPPHPGMLPAGPGMPGVPLPLPGPGIPGVEPGLVGLQPAGMPPRGPPLPGQLVPPHGMVPLPGFAGGPPGQRQQLQQQPGLKGMPPMQQQDSQQQQQQALVGAQLQQQQQQPGVGGPYGASPPRQQSPSGAPWGRPVLQQQQQQQVQQGSPAPRYPSPGGAGYDAAAAGHSYGASSMGAAGLAGEQSVAALVHRLRAYGSELMAADEINYILRIQHMATHGGHPYLEDFYYQAYLNKYYGGRNALVFAPAQLRDLASGDSGHEASEPRFADLSGLGKIVLSNIRTPKMLMDVGSGSVAHGAGKDGGKDGAGQQVAEGKARPLEQEPMLAARIMIEDCMLLLSDVEDIDRMFAAAAAAGGPLLISPAQAQALLHRRAALLGGIAASFRLPNAPTLPGQEGSAAGPNKAAAAAGSDGVFIRLMGLPKGRALVSKTLRLMFSPPPSAAGKGGKGGSGGGSTAEGAAADGEGGSKAVGLDVIWALLRNAELTFGPAVAAAPGSEAERRMSNATVALSAAASEMIKRLTEPEEAVACLAACNAGLEASAAAAAAASASQLLPLFPAGRMPADGSPDWLGSVLASLLLRASELGLGSFAASGSMRSLGEGYDKEARELAEQEELEAAGAASAAVASEWGRLLGRFVELVMLHLWALLQAVKGGGMAVVRGGGDVDVRSYVQKLSCVPLMRVLMAHCDAPQQEQLKSYLSCLSQ